MDTLKMVSEIRSACASLEKKKADLVSRLKEIDDTLTAYHMAIESLEMTVGEKHEGEKPNIAPREKSWSRKPVFIEFEGIRRSVPEWAAAVGITPTALRGRLNAGWCVKDALTIPAGETRKLSRNKTRRKAAKVFMYDQHDNVVRQFVGVGDASRSLNLPVQTVEKIIANVSREDQLRVRNYYLAYAD